MLTIKNYEPEYFKKRIHLYPAVNDVSDYEPVCPFCKALPMREELAVKYGVQIKQWVQGYPKYECQKCYATFFQREPRSLCEIRGSISIQTCKECNLFNPAVQCAYWKGGLTPPAKLGKQLHQERVNERFGKKERLPLYKENPYFNTRYY